MKQYYRSCKTLPLFNFFEIVDTGNSNWLEIGYMGEERNNKAELDDLWRDIFDEYTRLKNDENIKNYFSIKAEVAHLSNQIFLLKRVAYCFSLSEDGEIKNKLIEILNQQGISINTKLSKEDILKDVERNIKGMETNINRKKLQHKDIFQPKDEIKSDYEKDVANVELILDKNFIDTKKVTVSRWLAYLVQVDKKIKAHKKNGKG